MPRLPSVQDLQRPTPQPSRTVVPIRPVGPSPAVGQALEAGGARIAAGAATVFDALREEQERINTLRAEDAFNQLREQQLDLTFGDDGFTRRLGKDAISSEFRQEYLDRFDRAYKGLLGNLENDRQREIFNARYNVSRLQYAEDIVRHMGGEHSSYAKTVYDSSIDTEVQHGAAKFADKFALEISRQRIIALTKGEMDRLGLDDPEVIGSEISKNLSKLELAGVIREMGLDPETTATRLAVDPEYAPNIDPIVRENLVVNGFKRAEAERLRAEREADRQERDLADNYMKEIFSRGIAGTLDRSYVEEARTYLKHNEYLSALQVLSGEDVKDDNASYAHVMRLLVSDPALALETAFSLHANKKLSNSTLNLIRENATSLSRQGGPKTSYEREQRFITLLLTPSEYTMDPAPKARLGLALREYDDFVLEGDKSGRDLREKATEIVVKWSLVNIMDLAKQTATGFRNRNPDQMLEDLQRRSAQLEKEKDRLSKSEYELYKQKLNDLRKQIEVLRDASSR